MTNYTTKPSEGIKCKLNYATFRLVCKSSSVIKCLNLVGDSKNNNVLSYRKRKQKRGLLIQVKPISSMPFTDKLGTLFHILKPFKHYI